MFPGVLLAEFLLSYIESKYSTIVPPVVGPGCRVAAMVLVWEYGAAPERAAWRGLTWAMVPLLLGAMCACTWHFFYNSPDLEVREPSTEEHGNSSRCHIQVDARLSLSFPSELTLWLLALCSISELRLVFLPLVGFSLSCCLLEEAIAGTLPPVRRLFSCYQVPVCDPALQNIWFLPLFLPAVPSCAAVLRHPVWQLHPLLRRVSYLHKLQRNRLLTRGAEVGARTASDLREQS